MTAAAQVQMFDRQDRLVTKKVEAKDAAALRKKLDRLEKSDSFVRVLAWSD